MSSSLEAMESLVLRMAKVVMTGNKINSLRVQITELMIRIDVYEHPSIHPDKKRRDYSGCSSSRKNEHSEQ